MKTMIISAAFMVLWGALEIAANFSYQRSIGSYWELSDRASTLPQKSAYLDQYVGALEQSGLQGSNDALFLKTPANSFDQNMVALKSLQGRMHQIQGMDEQSFAYQTAISQITAQEQGEASHLTGTIEGCWYLNHWLLLWGWIDAAVWIVAGGAFAVGGLMKLDI